MISHTSAPEVCGGRRIPLLRLVGAGLTLCAFTLCLNIGIAARAQGQSAGSSGAATPKPSNALPTAGAPSSSSITAPTATPGAKRQTPASAVTMQLRRDVVGDLSYRFITAQDESAAPIPLPTATGGGEGMVVLPVTVKPTDAVLEIIDNARGKVAHLSVCTPPQVAELTDNDFNKALSVLVPVQSKGRAVVNATVTLSSRPDAREVPMWKNGKPANVPSYAYSRSWLLKPSDAGVASFANVPLGVPVTVTVTSGSDTPVSQTLTLPTNPPADGYRWQTIEVAWPTVHTVPLPAAPAPVAPSATPTTVPTTATPAPAPQPASNPVMELVNTLLSLVILGAFVYGLLWAYKQGHIKKMLDNLGIQTQPLATAGGPQGSPFDKPARTPIQPITEGTADPLAGAGFAPAVGAGAMPVTSAGPRLVATMGAYAGNIFPLAPTTTDIGRDAANPVALPQDTNTSRRHATIQALNGQYTVTDNGSSNGTYVNGVRITGQMPQPLRPGDELQIGMTRFRFEA